MPRSQKNQDLGLRGAAVRPSDIASISFDHTKKRAIIFHKEILLRQLQREEPNIAKSFDKLCATQINELSSILAQTMGLIYHGMVRSKVENDPLLNKCAFMLQNAGSSVIAAISTLRSGFRLEPGIILRTAIENICVVLHLLLVPGDLERVEQGKFNAPKAVSTACKIIPPIGMLYGQFSNEFSHISKLHQGINAIAPYDQMDNALRVNLTNIRICIWIYSVASELAFFPYVDNPRWWKKMAEGHYTFAPEESSIIWMNKFLQSDVDTHEAKN